MRNLLVGVVLACAALSAAAQQPVEPQGYVGGGYGISKYKDFCGFCRPVLNAMTTARHGAFKPATCSYLGSVSRVRTSTSARRTSLGFW